jgi:hypothetical protein
MLYNLRKGDGGIASIYDRRIYGAKRPARQRMQDPLTADALTRRRLRR